jgi:spermidine/putrescine transport system ATP-binding protein
MQVEVKSLHERLGTTFVFVTHDQDEALTMSDRIVVMSDGRVEQVGPPEQVYERPRTRFVADFLAVRNLLRTDVVSVEDGRAVLQGPGFRVVAADDGGYRAGQPQWIGIRPERLGLDGAGENRVAGVVEDEIYLGDRTDWRIRVGEALLTVAEPSGGPDRARGTTVAVTFPPAAVLRLDDAPRP